MRVAAGRYRNIGLLAGMTIQTSLVVVLLVIESVQSQVPAQNRFPYQRFFEDSTHVFWTWYPNPFSPPTVANTKKGQICGGLTFYCDLSDTVLVAFVSKSDSILYEAPLTSTNPPYFSLCYWIGGPRVSLELLPSKYFRSDFNEKIKLLLVVRGRWKSLRGIGITVQNGWYYWIDEHVSKHH